MTGEGRPRLCARDAGARRALMDGMDFVADLVAPTLGPCGGQAVLQRHDAPPLVTNDGVTIARSLELLGEPLRNQGLHLLREVASRADERLGDGTTTATLLARAIARGGLRHVAAGVDPNAFGRGLQRGATAVTAWIEARARPLRDAGELAAVAANAARSARAGALVAEALERVGPDGLVRVEDDRAYGVHLRVDEGMRFENGLTAPGLTFDPVAGESALDDCGVLVASERLTQVAQLAPILATVAAERRGLLIVSDEVSGDALTLLVLNVARRRIPVVAVKAPAFGPDRFAALGDIAAFTGATHLGPELGRAVERATLADLGRADRVVVTRRDTAIVGGHGDPREIARRMRGAGAEIGRLESEYERDKRRLRRARLGGAVATIGVGADTPAEQEETRLRVLDAVHAGRAALRAGVVPGAGTMLVRAADALPPARDAGDAAAARVLRPALEAPLRRLAVNAGLDPSLTVARVREAAPGHGVDVTTGRLVDLEAAGIVDPVGVVCATLEIAASAARLALLAEVIVAERPLPRRRRPHHSHHHHHHHDEGAHAHAHAHG